jgi:hypothetical protein
LDHGQLAAGQGDGVEHQAGPGCEQAGYPEWTGDQVGEQAMGFVVGRTTGASVLEDTGGGRGQS